MTLPHRARTWLVELGLSALGLTVGIGFLLITLSEEPETEPRRIVAEVLGGVVLAALLPLRRRWPVGLALFLIPTYFVFTTAMGSFMVALFTVAVRRRWPVTVAVATLHAAAVAAVWRLLLIDAREYVEGLVTILLLHVALVAVGLLVRSQRALVSSLRERARQAEEGQRLRIEEARLTERERLAREMHDVLAHRMSLLAVHAGALEVRRNASPEERQAAGVIRRTAHDAVEDLRQVIGMLRDDRGPGAGPDDAPADADRPQPTLADLADLVEQSRRAGAPITVDNRIADPPAVPAGIGRHAYRVVQEALTNARKHAPGSRVRVTLTCAAPGDPAGLTVEVANTLPTTSAPALVPGTGAGLIGLRERVTLVGGRLDHGPADGEFRLRAWLPWHPAPAPDPTR